MLRVVRCTQRLKLHPSNEKPHKIKPSITRIVFRNSSSVSSSNFDQEEEKYRNLFVTDRSQAAQLSPHVHLINVFNNTDSFVYEKQTTEEESIPSILSYYKEVKEEGKLAIASSYKEFITSWNSLTSNQFKNMNWNNVFVAGGSILACLQKNQFDEISYRSTDIDMFIYGLSEDEANKKLEEIYILLQKNAKSTKLIRSQYAITIIGLFPFRHTQVVLRIYQSPAEILMGFDIDACAVGFDGRNVYALPRAKRAIIKQYNLVDLSRRSLTYETRLLKYSKRGFEVKVPDLDLSKVSENLFFKKIGEVDGLAKLLLYDNLQTRKYLKYQKKQQNNISGIPISNSSDYSVISLPWGNEWNSLAKIENNINIRNDKASLQQLSNGNHIFITDLSGAFEGRNEFNCYCHVCQVLKRHDTIKSDPVSGPLKWITDNPGRQILTGSFHPVTDGNWWKDAYKSWEKPEGGNIIEQIPRQRKPKTTKTNLFSKKPLNILIVLIVPTIFVIKDLDILSYFN